MPKQTVTPTKKKTTTPPTTIGKPLQCNLCGPKAWTGPECSNCPLQQTHHYAEGVGAAPAAYFCVAESPYLSGPSGNVQNHTPWQYDVERIVKNAFVACKKKYSWLTSLDGRYTSAVRCDVDKPNKKVRECCYPLFSKELLEYAIKGQRPIMVFALGAAVLQALDIKVKKYADVQGTFIETQIGSRKVQVFPSLSKRQLFAKSGYFEILQQHIKTFMAEAYRIHTAQQPVELTTSTSLPDLITDYRFPKTLDEVRELVEEIVMYSSPGKDPKNHVIALDTETNTLYPHRKKLKILNLLVSWAPGKAAAIPIEHAESSWTLAQVAPYIKQLLSCEKPKIFHNAKFDLRVLYAKGWDVQRVSWDTMLGEHLLAEDKRGFYGLKSLTKVFLPKYAGYEDELASIRYTLGKEEAVKGVKGVKKSELKGAEKKLVQDDGFANVPLKILNEYGAVDADVTRRLCIIQRRRIQEEDCTLAMSRVKLGKGKRFRKIAAPGTNSLHPLTDLMFDRIVPATKTLARMEQYGMAVNREYLQDLGYSMDKAINKSNIALRMMVNTKLFKGGFNPNSSADLRKLFFGVGYRQPETNKLISYKGTTVQDEARVTDSGVLSTDAAFLKLLKSQHSCAFAKELLVYRAVFKARNTFVNNIGILSAEDGRMHTTFHISGTSTGRLSSSDENMQNIPKRIGAHNLKRIFIPSDPENQVIVNADAKAAEVRLYAAYSKDPNLIQALRDGMDPHSFFSATVYDPATVLLGVSASDKQRVLDTIGIDTQHTWSYEDFQNREEIELTDPTYGKKLDTLRKTVKRVVFGILYGASKFKIAVIVGIPQAQAQAIIDVLFRMFPTIRNYIKLTENQVYELGVVETFLGRRRRFNLSGMTRYLISKANRQAVNFKIQSTSSDIVIGTLCEVEHPIRDLGGHLLITVHDSLVFELPKKYVHQMPDFIQHYGVDRIAAQYPWLPVPFQWDLEVGPSYGDLQSVDKYLAHDALEDTPDDSHEELEIRQDFTNS